MVDFRIKNLELRIKLFLALFFTATAGALFILTALFYTRPAFAQTATSSAIPATVSPTSPLYTDILVNNIFHTFSCLTVGGDLAGQPCLTYQIQQNAQGAISSVPVLSQVNLSGGALGTATSLIAALYMNPPVRTAQYLATVGEDFGLVKKAHAQVVGAGAGVLEPITRLWQVSRNISYLIMIIIFVVIGLMVMFRQRINPQTVITAQAALPGLVIGLILITFSYFLAALITDMSFLGINVVGYYFNAAQQGSSSPVLVQDIADENVGSIFSQFVGMIGWGDIKDVIDKLQSSLDGGVQWWLKLFAGLIGAQTGASIGGSLGSLGGNLICAPAAIAGAVPTGGLAALIFPFCGMIGQLAGGAVFGTLFGVAAFTSPGATFGLVLYFVAIAIMIYTMFKLLLKLINNYLNIIFLTISAPFHFLAASLPGRQGIATAWVLNMLCNVLAFPAVFAVFYFVAYLWGPSRDFFTFTGGGPGELFKISSQLSVTGNQTLPLFGGLSLNFIKVLLAYGALLATPAIPDIICRTIGRPGQAGQLIGQEITAGTGAGRGYAGQFQARAGGLAGGAGRALGGEVQWRYDEINHEWIPVYGTPGVTQIWRTISDRRRGGGPGR